MSQFFDSNGMLQDLAPAVVEAVQALNFITEATLEDDGAAIMKFLQDGTGAASRTALAKLKDMQVSFEDFGAVGNGTADDTEALRKAILVSQTLGITVHGLSGKNYKITGGLQLVHPTNGTVAKVKGAGRNITTITPVGTFNAISAWGLGWNGAGQGAAFGVKFGGFDINAQGLTGNAMDIRRVGLWCVFEDLRITGANGKGMYLNSVFDHVYRDIEVRACTGLGIHVYESQSSDPEGFQECSFLKFDNVHTLSCNNRQTQWQCDGGDGYTFTSCKPSEGTVGIDFTHGCYGMTIVGMYADGQTVTPFDNIGIRIGVGCFCFDIVGGRFWNLKYAVDFVGGGRSNVSGINIVYNSPIGGNVVDVRLQAGVTQAVNISAGLVVVDNSNNLAFRPSREVNRAWTPYFGADAGTGGFTYTRQFGEYVLTNNTLSIKFDLRWTGKPPDWSGVGLSMPMDIPTGGSHELIRFMAKGTNIATWKYFGFYLNNVLAPKLYLYPDMFSGSAAFTASADFPADGYLIGEATFFLG